MSHHLFDTSHDLFFDLLVMTRLIQEEWVGCISILHNFLYKQKFIYDTTDGIKDFSELGFSPF